MAIEAGGKCGIFATDAVTEAYLKGRATQPWSPVAADADARYCCVKHYRCEDIEPQVAFPHSPDNTRPISAVGTVPIHQAVVGSCTNGRIEDLRAAAAILKGRKTAPGVRLIIFPATQAIYLQALREGLLETFIEAEAVVSTPTCGPCLGGHMGILARGETAIATTNRNFVGRMGHPESFVYLANPAITAASAVLGRIGSPDEL